MALDEDLYKLENPVRDPLQVYAEDEHPEPPMTVEIDDVGTMPLGDITAISGKAKAGKSYAVSILVASALGCTAFGIYPTMDNARVLYFDTEQSDCNIARIQRRIHRLLGWDIRTTNDRLKFYHLRELSIKDRWKDISDRIMEQEPQVVVIDGCADLMENFNDINESTVLITNLLDICSQCNIAVLTVLHENKSKDDDNMKGHLGTMLLQKAAAVFHLNHPKGTEVFEVVNTESRNRLTDSWYFSIDGNGLPVRALGGKEAEQAAKLDEIRKVLVQVFADGQSRLYTELRNDYMLHAAVSRQTAERKIKAARENDLLTVEGGKYNLTPP